jgi:CheY-like chemotaxis protein
MDLFSLDSLLEELHAAFEIQSRNKGLKLVQSINRENLHLNTDENRLSQVLKNLLGNAVKFTQVGEIEYGYKVNKDNLELFVRDTGIGVAPENHALIFSPFHQIDATATRRYGGTGLGLSISKALVEKMGGVITLKSEVGKGSVFSVCLPQEIIDHSQIKPNKSIEAINLLKRSEKAILIVEDEINNFLYVEEFVAGKFARTFHARNGQEALEMVADNPNIKLVLMDIKMPVMDGYEALQLIKVRNPDIPVIAVSAYALIEDKEMALNAGFDGYVSKPIKRDDLLRVLHEYS